MKKNILLVDDEINVIEGMQRMLYPMRNEWQIFLATDGNDALKIMEKEDITLIVSDMRMPKMDGFELLTIVKEKYPAVFRIALTGQSEKEKMISSLKITHKYLHKPCNSKDLISVIKHLLSLGKYINNENLVNIINGLGEIPLLPDTYWKLERELMSEEVSTAKISKLLSSDPLLTAKILQLVNSALFGVQATILDIGQAVGFLGIELLKSLILYVRIFSSSKLKPSSINFLFSSISGSIKTAEYAKKIAMLEKFNKKEIEEAYLSSLVKEIGIVVLAQIDKYEMIIEQINNGDNTDIVELENSIFGVTHPEIGAYLLSLWDFPEEMVKSVEEHHSFVNSTNNLSKLQTTVYYANALHFHNVNQLKWFEENVDSEKLKNWEKLHRE